MNINVTAPEDNDPLNVLATRIRAACVKLNGGRTQWVEGTLELAVVMLDARKELPIHAEFSLWLERRELQKITKDDRTALLWMGANLEAARPLLEQSKSISWDTIYRKMRRETALRNPTKGRNRTRVLSDEASGSNKRKRRNAIPWYQQDDYVPGERAKAAAKQPAAERPAKRRRRGSYGPAPERKAVNLKGLTREQVDPNFKGTPAEFAEKYGQVWLQTEQEIEYNKRQEELTVWVGLVADHEKTAQTLTAATVDPATLQEWLGKPGKAQKFRTWFTSIQYTCENLRRLLNLPENEPEREPRTMLSVSIPN